MCGYFKIKQLLLKIKLNLPNVQDMVTVLGLDVNFWSEVWTSVFGVCENVSEGESCVCEGGCVGNDHVLMDGTE